MQANYAQRWVNLDQAIQLLWKLAKQEGTSQSELNLIESYLRSLPQETTNQIRLDQLIGLLQNLQQAIKEGDADFLSQRRGFKSDRSIDILEFAESREFLGLKGALFDSVKEDLWNIWHSDSRIYVVVLSGAQRTAKSTTVWISLAYSAMLFSNLWNPQLELSMIPGDPIYIIIQSFKLENAEESLYDRLFYGIKNSPYFKKNFPHNPKMSSELEFANGLHIKPIVGSINAVASKNVPGGAITEINEMPVHKISVQLEHTNKQTFDIGQVCYDNFYSRVMGTYALPIEQGNFICRLFIDSSRRYIGDFTDRMIEESQKDPTVMVIERSLWEARKHEYPPDHPRFLVELATDYKPARIIERIGDAENWSDIYNETPENLIDDNWLLENLNVVRVPERHRTVFEKDLETALRDFCGKPPTATGRFIPYPKEITEAQDNFTKRTGGVSLFRVESIILKKDMPWHELINYDYIAQLVLEGDFRWSVHLDSSLGAIDAAGLGFDRIVDTTVVEKGYFYDQETGQLRMIENVEMPIHCVDGVLQILAPPGDHLDLLMLQDVVIELKQHINIVWASADWMQSESTIQTWRSHGIISGPQSVDKTPGAYFELRHAIRDGRVLFPKHSILDEEIRKLKRTTKGGKIKIDHPPNGSKDCADAICGAIATCHRIFRREGRIKQVQPEKKDNSQQSSVQHTNRSASRRVWGR